MIRWTAVLGLTLLWLLMWGDVTAVLVVGGLLVSVIVLVVFPFPKADWGGSFRPWPFLLLVGRFAVDLVVASVQVAWLAIRPQALGRSAIIQVQLHTRSDLLLVLTSELVSLVPGSLLIELDADLGILTLHVLDGGQDLARVEARVLAQEQRLIAALGSRAERDAYCSGPATTTPEATP
ncbi:Na+/H+ antiporter subunit E [Aeromicrobium sp.]|uniref:Na+/H+ antiporter subunit E n=1 Tax=Aeromicrobium sp. TaxID=1871063 RepID=UPI0025BD34A3|nr:Na+/H+ antiporter subunit E [Aeromicrobium sp.]MCK5891486.1 Na+/H+ antiporter subunit E [Aeromicrobium sp.]